MEVKIINTTPHTVALYHEDDSWVEFPKSELQCRVSSQATPVQHTTGLPCVRHTWDDADGQLPPPENGVYYIVSTLFADRLRVARFDILIPDSGPASAVRDPRSNILGVRRFTVPF